MKKIITVITLALAAILVLSACGNKKEQEYNYSTSDILDSIKEKMGDSYIPNTEIDDTMLTQQFGVSLSDIEEYKAEMPMIGFHPDRVVIVKAKSGSAEKIEEAFNEAKEAMVREGMQYPANIEKVNAAKIIRQGNYIAFLLCGAPDEGSESEQAAKEFAEKEVSVAAEAFNAFFKD